MTTVFRVSYQSTEDVVPYKWKRLPLDGVKIVSESCLQSPLDFARAHEYCHHPLGE